MPIKWQNKKVRVLLACPIFVREDRSSTGSYRLVPAMGTPGSSAVFMIFYATLTVEMICYDRSLKKCTPEL